MAVEASKQRRRTADVLPWMGEATIRPQQSGYHGACFTSLVSMAIGDERFHEDPRRCRDAPCRRFSRTNAALRWRMVTAMVWKSVRGERRKPCLRYVSCAARSQTGAAHLRN